MDGIFGVGIAEMVLIALAILVIGGPRNAAKWARDLGRFLRQIREMSAQMMKELENELGEDGREIMDATREFRRNVDDVRQISNPRGIARQASKLVTDTVQETSDSIRTAIDEADSSIQAAYEKSDPKNDKNSISDKVAAKIKQTTEPTATSTQAPPEDEESEDRYSAWTTDE